LLFDDGQIFLHEKFTIVLRVYFNTSIDEMKISELQCQHPDRYHQGTTECWPTASGFSVLQVRHRLTMSMYKEYFTFDISSNSQLTLSTNLVSGLSFTNLHPMVCFFIQMRFLFMVHGVLRCIMCACKSPIPRVVEADFSFTAPVFLWSQSRTEHVCRRLLYR